MLKNIFFSLLLLLTHNNTHFNFCFKNTDNFSENIIQYNPTNDISFIECLNIKNIYNSNYINLEFSFHNVEITNHSTLENGCLSTKITQKLDYVKYTLTFIKQEGSFSIIAENSAKYILFFCSDNENYFVSNSTLENAYREMYFHHLKENKLSQFEYQNKINELNEFSVSKNLLISPLTKTFAKSNENYIYGSFSYIDDYNEEIPLRFIKIEIWRFGSIYSTELITTLYTDEYGYFELSHTFLDKLLNGDSKDIFLRIYAAGINTVVMDHNQKPYYYQTSIYQEVSNGFSYNYSKVFNTEGSLGQAFSISQSAIMSSKFVKHLNNNTDIDNCDIMYPVDSSYAFYQSKIINLPYFKNDSSNLPNSYNAWDVIGHEYAHHVQNFFQITESPGGAHYDGNMCEIMASHLFDYANSNLTHEEARIKGIRLAYSEGWATIFSELSQQYNLNYISNIKFVGDSIYTSYNGVVNNLADYSSKKGEGCETTIQQIIYSLWDENNDEIDTFNISFEEFWLLSTRNKPVTFSDFITNCYDFGLNKFQLGKLLAHHKIAPLKLKPNYNKSYLDESPLFGWVPSGGNTVFLNNNFTIKFLDINQNLILEKTDLSTYTYQFTRQEWEKVLNSEGNIYYGYVIAKCIDYEITGPYYSELFTFNKPKDFKNKVQIKPSDFNFESQYFFYEKENSITINNTNITTKRLRCGYIENQFINLSPRRENAGTAFLELYFDKPVYSYMFGTTLWSNIEYLDLDDSSAIVEELNEIGTWTKSVDLLKDIELSTNREKIERYAFYPKNEIFGLRFIITSSAVGDRNKGRICLDDIVLNFDKNDLYFYTTKY